MQNRRNSRELCSDDASRVSRARQVRCFPSRVRLSLDFGGLGTLPDAPGTPRTLLERSRTLLDAPARSWALLEAPGRSWTFQDGIARSSDAVLLPEPRNRFCSDLERLKPTKKYQALLERSRTLLGCSRQPWSLRLEPRNLFLQPAAIWQPRMKIEE